MKVFVSFFKVRKSVEIKFNCCFEVGKATFVVISKHVPHNVYGCVCVCVCEHRFAIYNNINPIIHVCA
jgi:hypothetical protein